jgi:hypothetical protein
MLSVVMLSVVMPETVNKIKNLNKKTERNSKCCHPIYNSKISEAFIKNL